jgi:hypothetical protein
MTLVAVTDANQNCAASIQNDTIISEYLSAVLSKEYTDSSESKNYCSS